MGKQKDIKVTKAILSEEITFIRPKKSFKRNRNYQNSSYNEPLKTCNGFEVLHNNKVMTGNTIYSKEQNTNPRKIIANNIYFKEICKSQVFVNEFSD